MTVELAQIENKKRFPDIGYELAKSNAVVGALRRAGVNAGLELFVYIRNDPTQRHYDPELVTLPTRQGPLKLASDSRTSDQRGLAFGPIQLMDRKHRPVVFYAFDGVFSVTRSEAGGETCIHVASDLPIIQCVQGVAQYIVESAACIYALKATELDVQFRGDPDPERMVQMKLAEGLSPRNLFIRSLQAHPSTLLLDEDAQSRLYGIRQIAARTYRD